MMIWQNVAIGVDNPIKNKFVFGKLRIKITIGIRIAIPPIKPCAIEKNVFPIPLKYPIKQNRNDVRNVSIAYAFRYMCPLVITLLSLEKMLVKMSPLKNENVPMKHAMKSEIPIPFLSDDFALLIKPAPIFCATKALKLCEIAAGINKINPQTFSATPTPAEAISPSEFTVV